MPEDMKIGDKVIWTMPNGNCHKAKIVSPALPQSSIEWVDKKAPISAYPNHEEGFVIELVETGKKHTVPASELHISEH